MTDLKKFEYHEKGSHHAFKRLVPANQLDVFKKQKEEILNLQQ